MIKTYGEWIDITARGTSGDQVADILESWKADAYHRLDAEQNLSDQVHDLKVRAKFAEDRVAQLEKAISESHTLTTWLPYPENTPVVGETYNVLRHCPDGWDYQIATFYAPGWFSEILACSLRYVTHFAPLLPLPEE